MRDLFNWSLVNEMEAFDIAQALYWFCTHWHSGQSSILYSIQCQLEYQPGMGENGCEEDTLANDLYNELDTLAESNYNAVERVAEEVLKIFNSKWEHEHSN